MVKEAKIKKEVKTKKVVTKKEPEKKESRFKAFKYELSKVKWPEFKDLVKYTVATLVFCIFLIGFFMLLDLLSSLVKGIFA